MVIPLPPPSTSVTSNSISPAPATTFFFCLSARSDIRRSIPLSSLARSAARRGGVETLCRVSVKTEKQILGILSELRLFSGCMCKTLMQPQCATLTVDAIAILIVRMQVLFCYFAFLLNKLCLCRCTCFPGGPILCLFSSIFYHSGVLEPIPAVSRTGEVASLLQSIEHRDKQLFTYLGSCQLA